MLFLNRCFFVVFIILICNFSNINSKVLWKNSEKNNSLIALNISLENSQNNSLDDVNVSNDDENKDDYYSLNELGVMSDTLSHSSRSLFRANFSENIFIFSQLKSDLDEAKTATHHFFSNIFLEIQNYISNPYYIIILIMIIGLFLIIIYKSKVFMILQSNLKYI